MVGHKLDQLLTSLRLTPEEFADEIEVGKSTVYKLLRGDTKKLTRSMARKINNSFPKYSIDFLLDFNKEDEENVGEDYFENSTEKDTKLEQDQTLESLLGESVYKKVKPVLDELKNDNRKLKEILFDQNLKLEEMRQLVEETLQAVKK